MSAIDVLKEEVLSRHAKALLIYGGAHIFRWLLPGQTGITAWLERESLARVFVVMTQAGTDPKYQQFDGALRTAVRPVLVSLQKSPFREFTADAFLSDVMKRLINGRWVSVFADTDVKLSEMADACVYFGSIPRD